MAKTKEAPHKEILRCIGVKEYDLDEVCYQLENGSWFTSRYSSESLPNRWLFSLDGDVLGSLPAGAFVLFICSLLRQTLVVPAIELIRWLIIPDIPTLSDGAWRINIYKDRDTYEMSIPVTLERQTLSQYLNNFGVLSGALRQMERDLSDDWGESTKKIQVLGEFV